MRLNLRLKKALAMVAVSAVAVTTVPATVFAADYDTHWAKEMIEKWSEKEVLKGYEDGTFRPNGTVTRGELAAMIVRVFGFTDTSAAAKYTDVESTKWYAADIQKVSSAGIMNDYADGTFKPEAQATREEAAYAIAKAYQVATNDETSSFTDQAQIADWAEAEIAALVAGGFLNGNPDGSFRPQATLTRAEAVTMVHKITADLVNVAGVYSQDINGNLVVNTTGVELSDMTITGNLYLAEGIGEGEVKLNNVTVLGDIIVEGGSVNTIKVEGQSKVNNIIVDKAGKNPVRVLFGNLVEAKGTVTLKSNATIEGNVLALTKVVVDGAKEVQLVGGMKIEEIVVNQTTELALVDGVTVQTATINKTAEGTLLRGRGTVSSIKYINVNANGVELKKGFKYNKDNVKVDSSVTKAPTFPQAGGGGGGDNTTSNPEPPVVPSKSQVEITSLVVKFANDKEDVTVNLNGKKNFNIVAANDKITLGDQVIATSADTIASITAVEKGGNGEVTVKLGGLNNLSATLTAGTPQTLTHLKAEVAAVYNDVKAEILPLFKAELTDAQYKKLEERLEREYKEFQNSTATDINISKVFTKFANAQQELNGVRQATRAKLQAIANTIGNVEVSGLDAALVGEITVKVPVTLSQADKVSNDYTFTVTYR